ncbi:hypothetical protein IE4771_PB00002 (plasmid) [Rhizobium etli bv. mimosae str. IE4771]|uniref:Uncharacterized protein n=1 Tax=Rhizobium etli bv. mimosae str. IE4771 TaxID=1432050 RepID=A0A060I784_RHIET|nr:hypothetical protein IE4771_PB00002 [Rhizobium sp. IE4771]
MFSPRKTPGALEVDGLRFGCALGMKVHYPEILVEYENEAGTSEFELPLLLRTWDRAPSNEPPKKALVFQTIEAVVS